MNFGKTTAINADTRIKDLLDCRQDQVIEALVKLNKNFSKLKNPILRNVLARRVSVREACRIAGCQVSDFLQSMSQIGFQVSELAQVEEKQVKSANLIPTENLVELDVRPILAEHKDPLKEILRYIKDLKPGETLKLINTFEPAPLISLLSAKGFAFGIENPAPDLYVSYFTKEENSETVNDIKDEEEAEEFDNLLSKFPNECIKIIDVRHLEMPQPIVQILNTLSHIALLCTHIFFVKLQKLNQDDKSV